MFGLKLRYTAMIVALVISGMAGFCTFRLHKTFEQKVTQQMIYVEKAKGLKAAYAELKPYQKKWDEAYAQITPDSDMLQLYESINLKQIVPFSPDQMILNKVSVENSATGPMPLYRVCVGNSPQGFVVTEPTVGDALKKLDQLAARPDVRFLNVSLEAGHGGLGVQLDSICLLLRS